MVNDIFMTTGRGNERERRGKRPAIIVSQSKIHGEAMHQLIGKSACAADAVFRKHQKVALSNVNNFIVNDIPGRPLNDVCHIDASRQFVFRHNPCRRAFPVDNMMDVQKSVIADRCKHTALLKNQPSLLYIFLGYFSRKQRKYSEKMGRFEGACPPRAVLQFKDKENILSIMGKIILKAEDLDGYLNSSDKDSLTRMNAFYEEAVKLFSLLGSGLKEQRRKAEDNLISLYNEMGALMQDICCRVPNIHVYSFRSPQESCPEASRLIAKLRDVRTGHQEFIYYIQRAYEMLFKLAWGGSKGLNKNYLIVQTPVASPVQNYAVHKITNIDDKIENTVMCVMLRGALLPSMIMSKEIQEYSSHGYVTPFALFRIQRDDAKKESDMEYVLDLGRSYFSLESLDGKDLVFADPMNATGGSLVTIMKYLLEAGIKPKSVRFFNAISALKGALRVVRALENCDVYTLWMDPVLNEQAYIMPGLGDAGDRINGADAENNPRNIIQLIADYGDNIARLYRSQLREIEETVIVRK